MNGNDDRKVCKRHGEFIKDEIGCPECFSEHVEDVRGDLK